MPALVTRRNSTIKRSRDIGRRHEVLIVDAAVTIYSHDFHRDSNEKVYKKVASMTVSIVN